jgi:hypothetical protein
MFACVACLCILVVQPSVNAKSKCVLQAKLMQELEAAEELADALQDAQGKRHSLCDLIHDLRRRRS